METPSVTMTVMEWVSAMFVPTVPSSPMTWNLEIESNVKVPGLAVEKSYAVDTV